MIPKYDRLNGIDTDEETFDFICPRCKGDAIKDKDLFTIDLIGVVTKPVNVDNSDLPQGVRAHYDKLPTLRKALLSHTQDSDAEQIVIRCRECGSINTGGKKFHKAKFRKWVDKHYPEVLIL